jgi:hypothetical protein
VLQGYKNYIGVGYHANFRDPLGYGEVGVTARTRRRTSCPASSRATSTITADIWVAAAAFSGTDRISTTSFGPTKRSRKAMQRSSDTDWLIFDEPRNARSLWDLAYYDKIDTLPNAQNVDTTFTRLVQGEVGLHYTDVRRSLGAVDGEKGISWRWSAKGSQAKARSRPRSGTLDVGFPLPIPHSSIWLRSAAGGSNGDAQQPLANFYFGGFGNNYVDSRSISAIANTRPSRIRDRRE